MLVSFSNIMSKERLNVLQLGTSFQCLTLFTYKRLQSEAFKRIEEML